MGVRIAQTLIMILLAELKGQLITGGGMAIAISLSIIWMQVLVLSTRIQINVYHQMICRD